MDKEQVRADLTDRTAGVGLPAPFDWKRHTGATFEVDYTEAGSDLIYQFWPTDAEEDFRGGRNPAGTPVFAYAIEEVFASLLPQDAEVIADLIDVEEQAALAHLGGEDQRLVRPHEAENTDPDRPLKPTLYVRVMGVLRRPMAYTVMTDTLFSQIDTHPTLA